MDNVTKEEALRIKERFGDVVMIKETPLRFYPSGYEFSHVLGYVKKAQVLYDKLKNYGYTPSQRVGFLGIEQYYDSYLRGEEGGKLVEVDSQERIVGFLGEQLPQKGKDIALTIDSRMQKIAYEALSGYKGVVILMDSNNGDIFVLCVRPSYDLNRMTKGQGVRDLLSDERKPLINRAIQSAYPLGSVFKPIMATAGLEEKFITRNTIFNCPGYFMLAGTKFSCWDVHGSQNVTDALAHSCNVFFYNLGLRLGIERISHWAKKFSLAKKTGIDLPYEIRGFVPTSKWKRRYKRRIWFTGDTINTSIGQGYLKATPIEALVAITVFANGGYIVTPHLIKKVGSKETLLVRKNYLNISPYSLRIVKEGLRDVISKSTGTAHMLSSLHLGIAGKTGTAQNPGKSHGWFVGFFPYHNPKYSICVFLENGGSSHEALGVVYKFLSRLKSEGLIKTDIYVKNNNQ